MTALSAALDRYAEYNTLFLRLALGIVMVYHGLDKVGGVGAFAGQLDSMGIPVAIGFAWVVTIVELLGGLAILAGMVTRYAALLFAVNRPSRRYSCTGRTGFPPTTVATNSRWSSFWCRSQWHSRELDRCPWSENSWPRTCRSGRETPTGERHAFNSAPAW